jgi:hypothetical protein
MSRGPSLTKGHSVWKWKMDKETFENKKDKELTKEEFNRAVEALEKANVPGPYKAIQSP